MNDALDAACPGLVQASHSVCRRIAIAAVEKLDTGAERDARSLGYFLELLDAGITAHGSCKCPTPVGSCDARGDHLRGLLRRTKLRVRQSSHHDLEGCDGDEAATIACGCVHL